MGTKALTKGLLGKMAVKWHLCAMSFTATVENNMIKLPPNMALPDGTLVSIEPGPVAHANSKLAVEAKVGDAAKRPFSPVKATGYTITQADIDEALDD